MIKILFLVSSINAVGGAQKMAKYVIENSFLPHDCSIDIIPQQTREIELPLNDSVRIIRLKNSFDESKPRIVRIAQRFLASLEIKKTVKRIAPDFVFVFGITSSSLVGLKGLKLTKIYCERSDPFSYPSYLKKMLRKHLKDYKYIVLQTDNAKRFYDFIPENKKVVIPNPSFVSDDPVVGGNYDSNVLISAGRLVGEKRFDFVIKAFAEIKKVHHNLILKIYGNGEKKDELLKLIAELNLDDSVFILDGVPSLVKEIAKAKVFLFASSFEGVPNVVIEACSMGIPCVCTNCSPGGADYLTNGGKEGGMLVEIDDFDGYVAACLELIENKEKYSNYSSSGIKFRERFDKSKISSLWLELIH